MIRNKPFYLLERLAESSPMWSLIGKFQNCFLKADLYLTNNMLPKGF